MQFMEYLGLAVVSIVFLVGMYHFVRIQLAYRDLDKLQKQRDELANNKEGGQ